MKRITINITQEYEDTALKTDMLSLVSLVRNALKDFPTIRINASSVEVL